MRVNVGCILCFFSKSFFSMGKIYFHYKKTVISFAKCGPPASSLNFTHYFLGAREVERWVMLISLTSGVI